MVVGPGLPSLPLWVDEPLKPYTTFKVGGPARFFVPAASMNQVRFAVAFAKKQSLPFFTLGGGSNILVSDRGFAGMVLHPVFKGMFPALEDAGTVMLEVNAGEAWDNVVLYALENDWGGIENLSHIPGQAGAALVQNIGAYGQQVSDVVQSAEIVETATASTRVLSVADCEFGYRCSIFNTNARGQFIIVRLTLRLAKHGRPQLDYPDVRDYFQARGTEQPSLSEIRQAIISIRDRKFPYPQGEQGGNAGSFFKNLSLLEPEYEALREMVRRNFPPVDLARLEEIRYRFASVERVKIPAAFLIEICGLKGHRIGGAQVNEAQPLVLLNQGGATAHEVLSLARLVRRTVYERTGMTLAIEPELVGFNRQELEYLYTFE
jgi:UDP-N-acetylmuramate dehydrogenase